MRVLGFMTLHYGKEYLRESLLSIRDYCDNVLIAYSKEPSHGHDSDVTCPDKEQDMLAIATEVLGSKLIWHTRQKYDFEAQHRAVKYQWANGYDLCLTIDADEVYEGVSEALNYAYRGTAQYYGIDGYINFWRSFDWACYDGFRPIRIENLHRNNGIQDLNCKMKVYHFSTCQSEPVMRYKYGVFGHADEVKYDWLNGVYYKWTPENNFGDLHCVSIGLWNAVPFDKSTMPEYLKQHPNFNKYLI